MNNPIQIVDALKVAGHYFAAGAAAAQYGHPCAYGCHFGMRSDRDAALTEFRRGYDAAPKAR